MKLAPVFNELAQEMQTFRRALHSRPELSGLEFSTRDALVAKLKTLGFSPQIYPDHAGIMAVWPGTSAEANFCLALRADMDALPLREETQLPWTSKNSGIMHACGHDGHMAILLGVASWLHREGKHYPRPIKLLFQPSEESGDGASQLIAAGALEKPEVDAIFALHGWPEIPLGTLAVLSRSMMAAVDNFTLEIRGKGGHGAMPHLARDPIVAAAHLISQSQTLVSRRLPPQESAVLTFGTIVAGKTFNVIPELCVLKGTLRTLNPEWRAILREEFSQMVQQVAQSHGVRADLVWIESCPPTVNHPEMAEKVREAIIRALGSEHLIESPPSMGGEDFSFFLEKIPGAYFWLGLGMSRGSLHNPHFDFNDEAIATGIAVFASLITVYMEKA